MLIRPISPEDKPLIEQWIAGEPDHKDNTFEFYLPEIKGEIKPKIKSVIYEDSEGPIFAVRYSSALRIDIEFSNTANKERIRTVLKEGFPDVARQAKEQGFSEIVFNSISKTLIAFLRAFGFGTSPDYRKIL